MSKARVVILSVVVEGRSQADTARTFGVSPSWVSKLVARYHQEGEAAFEPRSRRPKTSPNALDAATVELIVELRQSLDASGLDSGPHTIGWHLKQRYSLVVPPATIWRYLKAAGLIVPEPKKRPKTSYVRFQADLPNEMWQSDFTHWRLENGQDVEILVFIDDCTRYALSVTAHTAVTGNIVVDKFLQTATNMGYPASVLTDNGMVYTTRLTGGKGGRNRLERTLGDLNIVQKHSRPNHPTTCGKVERFHQTLKKWLTAQPRARTIEELQQQIDRFVDEYNHRRPHAALGRKTPASNYQTLPKARPGKSTIEDHYRVRRDIVGDTGTVTLRHAGKLHHIGIGRTHARIHITMLIKELDIHIIDTNTGEIIRHLTLNPNNNYQPQQHQETPEP
ncbi:MAG: IS481 family transposase [Acidimicrobiia bacterium]|nr:IS481 family transposase [Acidimicrobiia bacterium]MDX2466919.1 IS481 family transposase [Acidimicrobiia bacterium]